MTGSVTRTSFMYIRGVKHLLMIQPPKSFPNLGKNLRVVGCRYRRNAEHFLQIWEVWGMNAYITLKIRVASLGRSDTHYSASIQDVLV